MLLIFLIIELSMHQMYLLVLRLFVGIQMPMVVDRTCGELSGGQGGRTQAQGAGEEKNGTGQRGRTGQTGLAGGFAFWFKKYVDNGSAMLAMLVGYSRYFAMPYLSEL